jgi:hypothetical protein
MWDDSKYVEWAAEQYEPKPETLSAEQVANVEALIGEVGANKPKLLEWVSKAAGWQVKALEDAPAEAYPHIVKQLEAKRKVATA